MYKTGQRIRLDARDLLEWLVMSSGFLKVQGPVRMNGEDRLVHGIALREFGWNYLPPRIPSYDRAVKRPLGAAKTKIAGVLPPSMRGLTETLTIVRGSNLPTLVNHLEIVGSRPLLDSVDVERLKAAIERRLLGRPVRHDRKIIERG